MGPAIPEILSFFVLLFQKKENKKYTEIKNTHGFLYFPFKTMSINDNFFSWKEKKVILFKTPTSLTIA